MKKGEPLSQSHRSFKQQLFLEEFSRTGNLSHSAEAAGISRQIVYYWRKASSAFAEQVLDAETESRDIVCANNLKDISIKVRDGNLTYQKFIRNHRGEDALRKVMSGKNLTWKGLKV